MSGWHQGRNSPCVRQGMDPPRTSQMLCDGIQTRNIAQQQLMEAVPRELLEVEGRAARRKGLMHPSERRRPPGRPENELHAPPSESVPVKWSSHVTLLKRCNAPGRSNTLTCPIADRERCWQVARRRNYALAM